MKWSSAVKHDVDRIVTEQLLKRSSRDVVHGKVLADRRAIVGTVALDHPSLRIARASPRKMQVEARGVGHIVGKGEREHHRRAERARGWARGRPCDWCRNTNR